jgi:DNA primase
MKAEAITIEAAGREVRISNPAKLFFPQPGFTKLDLV